MVPDFDPEVEYSLEQTLSGISQEIGGEEHAGSAEPAPEAVPGSEGQSSDWDALGGAPKKRRRRLAVWLGSTLVILIIVGTALWIAKERYDSEGYQVERAQHSITEGDYDRAISYYERALELKPESIELKFALAEAYFLKNNKVEYEYLLRDIVKDKNATMEQLESAYGKLIAIYNARGDYKTINELILSCENESIQSIYQSYLAMAPEFSIAEGYYNSIQPLKLTTFGTGKIYYTMDGSDPDENSSLYTAPILLEGGEYTVKAVYVNEMGIASEVVSKKYYVEIEVLPAPEISVVSGNYEFPISIEVLDEEGDIYYTKDGSVPTMDSSLYTDPIPMPLGESTFKFKKIEEGKSSEVVERSYCLVMNTEYMPEQAVEDVTYYSVSSGKINDISGSFDHTEAAYLYEYLYVTNIGGVDDFYVIAEVLRDAASNMTRTGNYFAVNAYTGVIFKLQLDNFDNYELVEINE